MKRQEINDLSSYIALGCGYGFLLFSGAARFSVLVIALLGFIVFLGTDARFYKAERNKRGEK